MMVCMMKRKYSETLLDKISRGSIIALIYVAAPLFILGGCGILIMYIIKLLTGE